MTSDPRTPADPCPGCRRPFPPPDGGTHAYIGASPGCWARYGELLALEYADPQLMRWHRLTVDAYAAQHPGVPGRRSAQSVHVHLAGLHLVLERGFSPAAAAQVMQGLADGRAHGWLEPPALATGIALPEALAAAGTAAYAETVTAWAQGVWQAWSRTMRRSAPKRRPRALHSAGAEAYMGRAGLPAMAIKCCVQ